MVLKFKSKPDERVLIEREGSGTQRVAKAVQSESNDHVWKITLEHPSGSKFEEKFHGNGLEVMVGLAELMSKHELTYMHEKNRGHRPAPKVRDLNTAISDLGDVSAPITKRW